MFVSSAIVIAMMLLALFLFGNQWFGGRRRSGRVYVIGVGSALVSILFVTIHLLTSSSLAFYLGAGLVVYWQKAVSELEA